MRPEDLLRSSREELSDEQHAAFDLQCFKEFVRSLGYHLKWAEAIAGDEGFTPWQRFEEETGKPLPCVVAGRRVPKFNILNLLLGRKLSQDPLLEAFEDLEDIAGGRPAAMVFKFAGDQFRRIPGTKMVMTTGVPDELSGLVLCRKQGSRVWIGPYKAWRDWFADGYADLAV